MPRAETTANRPSQLFLQELDDVQRILAGAEKRLRALHDQGAYEELAAEPVNRLRLKANAIAVTLSGLEEIPEMLA
jgi:hypothetical protein